MLKFIWVNHINWVYNSKIWCEHPSNQIKKRALLFEIFTLQEDDPLFLFATAKSERLANITYTFILRLAEGVADVAAIVI